MLSCKSRQAYRKLQANFLLIRVEYYVYCTSNLPDIRQICLKSQNKIVPRVQVVIPEILLLYQSSKCQKSLPRP